MRVLCQFILKLFENSRLIWIRYPTFRQVREIFFPLIHMQLATVAVHKTEGCLRIPSVQSVPYKEPTVHLYMSGKIYIWKTIIQWLILAGHLGLWCVIKHFTNTLLLHEEFCYLLWDEVTVSYGFKVPVFCRGHAFMHFVSVQIQFKVVTNFIADNHVHNGTSLCPFHFCWAKHQLNRASESSDFKFQETSPQKMCFIFILQVFCSPDVPVSPLN